MPSTYTSRTGIELIATGEQSGTWGDTTNTNIQIVDRASPFVSGRERPFRLVPVVEIGGESAKDVRHGDVGFAIVANRAIAAINDATIANRPIRRRRRLVEGSSTAIVSISDMSLRFLPSIRLVAPERHHVLRL